MPSAALLLTFTLVDALRVTSAIQVNIFVKTEPMGVVNGGLALHVVSHTQAFLPSFVVGYTLPLIKPIHSFFIDSFSILINAILPVCSIA